MKPYRLAPSILVLAAALCLLGLCCPTLGSAAGPPQLWKAPSVGDAAGSGRGEFANPWGVGVDPVNGHLYVADLSNARIDELTAWGGFVRAWGWGVSDGATGALQTCTATCFKGIAGGGAGQIRFPRGVAVDGAGNVYVDEPFSARVQKFNSAGEFLLTFGGGVITAGAAGSGDLIAGSTTVTSVTATLRAFAVGQAITGTGIPSGTMITAVGVGTLALSKAATASGSGVALTAPAGAGNVPTDERQRVTIGGSPTGGTFSLTLTAGSTKGTIANGSDEVTATSEAEGSFHLGDHTNVSSARGKGDLSAGSQTVSGLTTSLGSFQTGQPVAGTGIPVGATIVSVGAGTLTLSAPATRSVTEAALTAFTAITAIDATNGSFALSANATGQPNEPIFALETTAPIPFDASAAEVQEELEALPDLGAGSVAVAGPAGGPWTVEFEGPLLGDVNVAQMSGDGGSLTSSGSVEVSTLVQGAGAAEVCTAAHAADCREGVGSGTEAGPGQLSAPVYSFVGNKIAIGPNGDVFAGDRDRIEEFEPSGAYKGEVPIPAGTVVSLAMDAAGDFYVSLSGKEGVLKLSPSGALLHNYVVEVHPGLPPAPEALATDAAGDLYVVEVPQGGSFNVFEHMPRVVEFAPDGSRLIPTVEEEEAERKEEEAERPFAEIDHAELQGLAISEACGIKGHDVYVSANNDPLVGNVRAYGSPPQDLLSPCEPPPHVPPATVDQYAVSAGTDGAVVQAKINPHFWPDATYQVQYGTGKCSEGGCGQTLPAPPVLLGKRVLNEAVTSAGISLPGLSPHTTYHFRFVAQSGGGGPVFGVDPDGGGPEEPTEAKGLEGTFTTASLPLPSKTDCSNQVLRSGPSVTLPDCRAYEMVSPVDKNGADIVAPINNNAATTAVDQSAVAGGRFAYTAGRAFGDAPASPYAVEYMASRRERGEAGAGWSSHAISPPRGINILAAGLTIDAEFRAFSPDLCQSWLMHDADPTLAPDAIAGFPNLYHRQDCGSRADSYEALTTVEPPGAQASSYILDLQGVSADGTHAVFQAPAKLTANANAGTGMQCYESIGEAVPLRLVSVLPNGTASEAECSLGTDNATGEKSIRSAQVSHAISADGSRIYWTALKAEASSGTGQIYLRVAGKDPTTEVSGTVSKTADARFLTAAADGSRAIFLIEDGKSALSGNLYEFNVATGKATLIAAKTVGLLGASEDASRIYFVSEKALGGAALTGKPNLYFREVGAAPRFIAILAAADAKAAQCGFCVSPLADEPVRHTARVSPDGGRAVFMSALSLTGFDNTDAGSGEPDSEVFLYDATADDGAGKLFCVSCDAAKGTRPSGRELVLDNKPTGVWAAAQIPLADNQVYAPRVLSGDGARVFFDSYEPLVPRDTNARQDVYEWEPSASQAHCEDLGAELYVAADGGCLSLISSGDSPQDSELLDISADGTDVFFTTGSSLVPQDPGLIDVYDARVEGGFPPPAAQAAECEGVACQGPAEAPNDPTPASASFAGAGNLTPSPLPVAPVTPRSLTRAQKLAKALQACHRKPKRKRVACERQARKRYGPPRKSRKASHTTTTYKGG